jgi:hypothetical protein
MPRQPAKTKDELREMLAEAVRNTALPEPERPQEGSQLNVDVSSLG